MNTQDITRRERYDLNSTILEMYRRIPKRPICFSNTAGNTSCKYSKSIKLMWSCYDLPLLKDHWETTRC
jgi:hypothetical protein